MDTAAKVTPVSVQTYILNHSFLLQSEKKEILRRLNQNLKEQSPVAKVGPLTPPPAEPCATVQEKQSDTGEERASNRDRKKWEAGEPFVLPVAQQTLEETSSTINGWCSADWMALFYNRNTFIHPRHGKFTRNLILFTDKFSFYKVGI